MLFASAVFLLAFLPAIIACYYTQWAIFGNRLRNGVLLASSYLFYVYGAADFVLILLASTATDYLLGLLIEKQRRYSRWWVGLSVLINLGVLAYFKYANFMVGELSRLFKHLGQECELLILTAEAAAAIPEALMRQTTAAGRPLLLVVPDARERHRPEDLAAMLRGKLGMGE